MKLVYKVNAEVYQLGTHISDTIVLEPEFDSIYDALKYAQEQCKHSCNKLNQLYDSLFECSANESDNVVKYSIIHSVTKLPIIEYTLQTI